MRLALTIGPSRSARSALFGPAHFDPSIGAAGVEHEDRGPLAQQGASQILKFDKSAINRVLACRQGRVDQNEVIAAALSKAVACKTEHNDIGLFKRRGGEGGGSATGSLGERILGRSKDRWRSASRGGSVGAGTGIFCARGFEGFASMRAGKLRTLESCGVGLARHLQAKIEPLAGINA